MKIPPRVCFAWLYLLTIAAVAQDSSQPSKHFAFEVVSIRPHKPGTDLLDLKYLPNGYRASVYLEGAIKQAYLPHGYVSSASKILNAPDWLTDSFYDIDARVAPEDMAAWQRALTGPDAHDSELLHSAFRAVLADRFKLALHVTAVDVPYRNIVVAKHGARLQPTIPGAIKPISGKTSAAGAGFFINENGKRQFVGVSMDDLANVLMRLDRTLPVQDKTGLTGRYDFIVPWYGPRDHPSSEIPNPLDRMPLTGVGLELKSGTGPGFVINIDHIERPDSN
jgi:uncharacterized protein (TIGR03435 family)